MRKVPIVAYYLAAGHTNTYLKYEYELQNNSFACLRHVYTLLSRHLNNRKKIPSLRI